jgi:Spy/CpxP family protein refolding chaperone
MFRKMTIALVATAALGTAALAPTSASAWGWHGGFHHGWHGGWFHRGWGYAGWGPGPGWCYYHPYRCGW